MAVDILDSVIFLTDNYDDLPGELDSVFKELNTDDKLEGNSVYLTYLYKYRGYRDGGAGYFCKMQALKIKCRLA